MASATLRVMFVLKKCREAENLRTLYILWMTGCVATTFKQDQCIVGTNAQTAIVVQCVVCSLHCRILYVLQ